MLKTVSRTFLVVITFIVLVSCQSKYVDIVYKDVNLIPMTGGIVVESISVHISEGKFSYFIYI